MTRTDPPGARGPPNTTHTHWPAVCKRPVRISPLLPPAPGGSSATAVTAATRLPGARDWGPAHPRRPKRGPLLPPRGWAESHWRRCCFRGSRCAVLRHVPLASESLCSRTLGHPSCRAPLAMSRNLSHIAPSHAAAGPPFVSPSSLRVAMAAPRWRRGNAHWDIWQLLIPVFPQYSLTVLTGTMPGSVAAPHRRQHTVNDYETPTDSAGGFKSLYLWRGPDRISHEPGRGVGYVPRPGFFSLLPCSSEMKKNKHAKTMLCDGMNYHSLIKTASKRARKFRRGFVLPTVSHWQKLREYKLVRVVYYIPKS